MADKQDGATVTPTDALREIAKMDDQPAADAVVNISRAAEIARAALAAAEKDESELVEALRHAVAIIKKYVPIDALGRNSEGGGDGWNDRSWPILEEYLHYMDEALAKHAKKE